MNTPVFTCDWFSQNIPALTEVLAKFKGKPDIHALEIGCFEGRGTLWLLNNILTDSSCSIVCIDTFDGSAEHTHFGMDFSSAYSHFRQNTLYSKKIDLMVGRSCEEIRKIERRFDIAYVDGSHMATEVLTDMVLSWPLLKKGGIMFCDDYEWPGTDKIEQHMPKVAIDAFTTIFIEQLKFLYKGYSVAIEKTI